MGKEKEEISYKDVIFYKAKLVNIKINIKEYVKC
jgi:hypothetical protein